MKKEEKEKQAAQDKILSLARARFKSARMADKRERMLADEDTRFAINDEGCQWDQATRDVREQSAPPRPCLVMNKIPEKIDQAEGEFRQLRPSIKVKAVDNKADPKIAEIIGGIIRNIEYNSNARAAYNTCHSAVLHGGRGAWRINVVEDDANPFEKDIIIDRVINPLSITWDQSAIKIDRSDASFNFISTDMLDEEFKANWPDATFEGWDDDDSYNYWRNDDTIRVAEYWWIEQEEVDVYQVQTPDGRYETVWELEEGQEPIDTKKTRRPKVRWCLMTANQILEGPFDDWPGRFIPIILEFGKETTVGGKIKTRGMVRFAKDPQRMYNYWTSTEAEAISTTPKAPYLMTSKMVGKFSDMWNAAATKNYTYLLYEPDPSAPGGMPVRQMPPQMSSATVQVKATMEHDIMSAMNVYAASLGDQGAETSGIAIQARQRQGSIGAYGYTDNFESALIHSFKVILDLIPHVYDSERIIRMRGESGTESMIPINAQPDSPMMGQEGTFDKEKLIDNEGSDYINDVTIGKYDVVATIGPSYTTQREEALDTMIRVLETMPNLASVSPDLIVGLLDIPMSEELLQRAKKLVPPDMRTLEPGEEPPQEEPPAPEQMFKMKELEIKYMTEQRKMFETQVNSLLTLAKAEAEEQGIQMPQYIAQLEALTQQFQQQEQGQQPQGV